MSHFLIVYTSWCRADFGECLSGHVLLLTADPRPRPVSPPPRPGRAARWRRPLSCLPSSAFSTEIDAVCMCLFPAASQSLRASKSLSAAARHRGQAFPPGQASAPPSGSAPGPSFHACDRVLVCLLSRVRARRCPLGPPAAASAWQRLRMKILFIPAPLRRKQKYRCIAGYTYRREKATEEEKDGGEWPAS